MHHLKFYVFLLLFVSLLPANAFAAKGSINVPPPGTNRGYGGILRIALTGDPPYINPARSTLYTALYPGGPIYQALVSDQMSGIPAPELAESWQSSADYMTWTFRLVKNATWHDGQKFTSSDVKFSFEKIIIPYHPTGNATFGTLRSAETPDDYTAVLTFRQPFPGLLTVLSQLYAPILPKHIWEGTDVSTNPANVKPIGTGPFMFKEYVRGDHITLVKNPNYWKTGLPYLDQIIFRIIPDNAARHLAFENGEVDYIPYGGTTYYDASRLISNPKAFVSLGMGNAFHIRNIYLKVTDSITGNLKVRQAIAQAINRQSMVDTLAFGLAAITNTAASPQSWWYSKDAAAKFPQYDPAAAQKLLDDAGYPTKADGKRFTLTMIATNIEDGPKIVELLRDDLAKVGIGLNAQVLEHAAAIDAIYTVGQFQIAYSGGSTTGPDPGRFAKFVVTKSQTHLPFTNAWGYSNPKVDQAFDLQGQTADQQQRIKYMATVQDELVKDLPLIPFLAETYPQIVSPDFFYLPPGPSSVSASLDATLWAKGTSLSVSSVSSTTSAVTPPPSFDTTTLTTVVVVALIVVAGILYMKRKRHK